MTQPLPSPADLEKPFWQGALQNVLRIQECGTCRLRRYPDAPVCARCGSTTSIWADLPGTGTISAWCRFHRAYFEGFAMPHGVLLIQLDDGPLIFGNWARTMDDARPVVGMRVEPVFEWIADGIKMPRFRPAPRVG